MHGRTVNAKTRVCFPLIGSTKAWVNIVSGSGCGGDELIKNITCVNVEPASSSVHLRVGVMVPFGLDERRSLIRQKNRPLTVTHPRVEDSFEVDGCAGGETEKRSMWQTKPRLKDAML